MKTWISIFLTLVGMITTGLYIYGNMVYYPMVRGVALETKIVSVEERLLINQNKIMQNIDYIQRILLNTKKGGN